MKIKAAKCDLEAALTVVNPSMAGTGGDLTTHYLFRKHKDDGKAEVLTYSGRIYAGCPFVAEVELDDEDGAVNAFTIEGKRLRSWLGAVPDAALSFAFDQKTKKVKAKAPNGTQTFQSLDPDNFPYWDDRLKEAEEAATFPAHRLHAALNYARLFASVDESRTPELCVCEVRDGGMAATNKVSAVVIQMPGFKDASLRVHVKDAATILSFLGTIGTGDVVAHTHDRCVFFVRADGAIQVEGRLIVDFPNFKAPTGDDQRSWTVKVSDLKNCIAFLTSGAAWEDNRLHFTRPDSDGPVVVSMLNTTGTRTKYEVGCPESGEGENVPDLPADGFVLAHEPLTKMLDACEEDTIRLGVNVRGQQAGGYLRYVSERFGVEGDAEAVEPDTYLTLLPWLK